MSSRRNFIMDVTGTTAALCCVPAAVLLDGCTSVKTIQTAVIKGKLVVDKVTFAESKFVIVKSEALKVPVYLSQVRNDSYRAFLMVCTHKACELRPTGPFLSCPCHGSEFSNTGEVLKGPAMDALNEYSVELNGPKIVIDLNQTVNHGKEN
ncbi:MAG: Rieske 2Fe-2S domain-containing protein [Flavobacteriales bacterium]|nr:Rieske 2Fe-2S domain-containing protein [Flavobacteriales bacterium]